MNRAKPHTSPTLLDLERSNYGYGSENHKLNYYEIGCLPNHDWMWSHAWMLDYEFLHGEWSYGTSIHGMNRRLAEGTNRAKKSLVDFLRRRRWIRTRIRKPCLEMEESSEHLNENSSNQITVHVNEPEYSMSLSQNGQYKVKKDSKRHLEKRFYHVFRNAMLAHLNLQSSYRLSNINRVEFDADAVEMEGWLGIRGTISRSWKLRYCVLRFDTNSLICLRDRTLFIQVNEIPIDRHTSVLLEDSGLNTQHQFSIIYGEHKIRLNATTHASRTAWLEAISGLIVRSRASFVAVEDSDSNHSLISKTRRRVRSRITSELDSNHSDGTVSALSYPSVSSSDLYSEIRQSKHVHRKKRVWRPYTLICSAMSDKRETDSAFRLQYVQKFKSTFEKKMKLASTFLNANLNVLEKNMIAISVKFSSSYCNHTTEQSMEVVSHLRRDIEKSLEQFYVDGHAKLRADRASVLLCNRLGRDLYLETKRLNDLIVNYAVPATMVTEKKKTPNAPVPRIPTDWFDPAQPKPMLKRCSLSDSTDVTSERAALSDDEMERRRALKTCKSFSEKISHLDFGCTKPKIDNANPNSQLRYTCLFDSDTTSFDRPQRFRSATTTSQPLNTTRSDGSNGTTGCSIFASYEALPDCLSEGQLELPSGINNYVVPIWEKDLGSLIAFALCSDAYMRELEAQFRNCFDIRDELSAEEIDEASRLYYERRENPKGTKQQIQFGEEEGAPELGSESDTSLSSEHEVSKKDRWLAYMAAMKRNDFQHADIEFAYEDRTAQTKRGVRCIVYFAAQFHALRALIAPGNFEFLNSILKSMRWDASGGKSGAFFSLTHDKRYVLKGISLTEFNMFHHLAPHYFKYMEQSIHQKTRIVMSRIVGLYKLCRSRRHSKHTTYVVVMESMTYGFPPAQLYDLKGILRRRCNTMEPLAEDGLSIFTKSSDRDQLSLNSSSQLIEVDAVGQRVLLDGNLYGSIPIPVRQSDLINCEAAIQNDTTFLCRAGVVDYSILLMLNEKERVMVVGLIDYIHQFDFLKKMESTSKASIMFRNPTIINPNAYQRRFVNAMHRYLVGIDCDMLKTRKSANSTQRTQTNDYRTTLRHTIQLASQTEGDEQCDKNQSIAVDKVKGGRHKHAANKVPRLSNSLMDRFIWQNIQKVISRSSSMPSLGRDNTKSRMKQDLRWYSHREEFSSSSEYELGS
ncbi:unnamed protein product [Albugo candida]|nr:unnamed protein product [Albugo candida]|eukprot:CCI42918.1 unnamed protein product [Albugo candida]